MTIDVETAIDHHLERAEQRFDAAIRALGQQPRMSVDQALRYAKVVNATVELFAEMSRNVAAAVAASFDELLAMFLRPPAAEVVGLDARDEDPHAIAPAGQLWEREAHRAADWEPDEVLCWALVGTENGNEEEPCELPLGHEGPHEADGAVGW